MRGLLGMGRKAHGRVNNWQQQWVRAAVQQMPRRRSNKRVSSLRVLHRTEKSCKSAIRHVAHRASPRPRMPRARCAAPCTRAHACRARSTRTHHACATRQQCTCSHTATRAHVKKLGCRARVTGHWLTVGRLAACTSDANALFKHARHLRCSRGLCVTHTLCLPSTTDVGRCHRCMLTLLLFADTKRRAR